MAEMAVEQTREHFLARDGHLVDNPRIGPELAEHYWRAGNSRRFGEFVESLCGAPLSAQPLAKRVNQGVDHALARARESLSRETSLPRFDGPVELDAELEVIHGRQHVTALGPGGFDECAGDFSSWITSLVKAAE
jgi:hypothetical protein